MNLPSTVSHNPFPVSNPIATDPSAWEREVALPLRAAELRDRMNELQTVAQAPALGMGERAALKRQIHELQRRIDALGVEPKDG